MTSRKGSKYEPPGRNSPAAKIPVYLSDLSIRRPVFAWMLMFGIILFGLLCYQDLGVSYMPEIDYPTLSIEANWTGAVPEVMETEIVEPIEKNIVAVEGLKSIHSTVSSGAAWIVLDFNANRNIDEALQEVQAYLQQVPLPTDVQIPRVYKSNTGDENPMIRMVISGKRPIRELADYVDKYLQPELQSIEGVGNVTTEGYGNRTLLVRADNEKLKALQLSVLDIEDALKTQHVQVAGGSLENDRQQINIRTMGEGPSPAQIANELILKRGGESIYDTKFRLGDVARIEDGLSDDHSVVESDGKTAILVELQRARGYNEVDVARRVKARLAKMVSALPPDMEAHVIMDYTLFTQQAIDQTLQELLMACVLTSVICFLFLGSWSSAVNVLVAIPTSIIGTFVVLYLFHFTLNLFTLLALALAIGIVVDDAIMVLENIVRHFDMGKSRRLAAKEGTREISFAAIAATLAVVAIFIPVAFMNEMIGKYFFQFAITMSAAVLLSLLEAITLTPMRCSKFLNKADEKTFLVRHSNRLFATLTRAYRSSLGVALTWRWIVLGVAAIIFFASLSCFWVLRQEVIPRQDENYFYIYLNTPVGSSTEYTRNKVAAIVKCLTWRPEVAHYISRIGGDDGGIDVVLVDKAKRKVSAVVLMDAIRKEIKSIKKLSDVDFGFYDPSDRGLPSTGGGRNGGSISFRLRGSDYTRLDAISKEVMKQMTATGQVNDMHSDYFTNMPEADVIPDRAAAALWGVSIDSIAQTINVAMGGSDVGKFSSGQRRYDVVLRIEAGQRQQLQDILGFTRVEQHGTTQRFTRIDRQRSISVFGNLVTGVSQADAIAMAQRISKPLLPPDYDFYLEGNSSNYRSTFDNLWFALVLGLVVAYMILAVQFDSFFHPISVLLALPFSLTGALLSLWVTNESLNMFSMIGIILLMGIAKKNSILLVEFTNHLRQQDNRSLREALLDACPIRLRPILMTSIATMSSAVPTALGIGPGSEARVPMAVALLGGIFISTIFTLYVVPCAHSWLAQFDKRKEDFPEELSLGTTGRQTLLS
jgi:hydrophobe/amphiphile efflux-1 (HAE1) family protein